MHFKHVLYVYIKVLALFVSVCTLKKKKRKKKNRKNGYNKQNKTPKNKVLAV